MAALAGLPVILVLDISGQSQTAAAAARGFADFRPGVEIAGVILNRAGSPRHEKLARAGFDEIGMRVFGVIPRRDAIALPERHLGLVQAGELSRLSENLDALGDLAEAPLDVEALLKTPSPQPSPQGERGLAAAFSPGGGGVSGVLSPLGERDRVRGSLRPPGQRIALAKDAAFSFVYPHLLKSWRSAGAEILLFSPLADEAPPDSADMAWLPGGYPELHAGRLASNSNFLAGVRSFAATRPVHGECGGYMVLGEGLIDANGERHAMLGLLRLETSFAARKLHLGYRRGQLLMDCVLGTTGDIVTGHEFHYSSILAEEGEKLFSVADAEGLAMPGGGLCRGNVSGSFLHFIDKWEPVLQARI